MSGGYEYRDVTGTIDCTDPRAVAAVAIEVLVRHHPELSPAPLEHAFNDVEALYAGRYPGFHACDMQYHDLAHVLDVCLAMIRLADGYQRHHGDGDPLRLSGSLLVTGILVALFHDAGYLRRRGDRRARNGAEYTRVHVTRSAAFLRHYLPRVGYREWARLASRLVQFTGYEVDLDRLRFADPRQRRLGELIGTADILAQMSDRCYLDKCRDCLYPEFELAGMTSFIDGRGRRVQRYRDAVDLLRQTPDFIDQALSERLGRQFNEAWRYVEAHFDGANPYLDAIAANRQRLQQALAEDDPARLEQPFSRRWRSTPA